MLKFKYLFENYDLAKTFINRYTHDQETLDDTLSHFRISANAIYPFYANQKLQFLRLSPACEKQLVCIQAELEFLHYLNNNQFSALIPVKSLTGDFIITQQTMWGEYHAVVFESVNGYAIDDLHLTDTIVESFGNTLGKLHLLSSQFNPNLKRKTHTDVFDWIESVYKTHNVSEEFMHQLMMNRLEMQSIQMNKDNYGLIHYDYEIDNVFYDEKTLNCSVIDFDDSMYHFYVVDIIQALESLKEIVDESHWEYTKSLFLKAYENTGRNVSGIDSYFDIMRKFCHLYQYGRIMNSISEQRDDEPIWMTELRKKLIIKMRTLEKNITSH
ncbi:MAG: hypothetical protein A2Y45_08150 [Tenericutes bacterium GWC2_34_14]|nr:MAG: hypothetical protein A2Z84_01215 [Tenericutes bacterium GWA2_35_7]OHE29869.1 MAG: hypothetical protein A2Y45_08150 [Tenericutes bacterium GWC2_34_14]OHE34848.1 MAG: hypothetical protein A2012_01760 [Tenericutes bacterium GWE2_34_108]OHE37291.1 MAG: hypothetical protein A2Y46_01250 [Tenericutes bacterium GWF1_35_14]OHE39576.1 MAG: hypothetical protein A2Y44_01610 [Tenericutes bacterium GWF2_35_184]OHE43156.1 MAG: hypothetical protein A3K26_02995 [Tenericutes bacterium RIFOXYA12_FULL_35_